jgi:hypothetical protein
VDIEIDIFRYHHVTLAGLETITSGDLFIGDTRMNEIPPAERGVGMVFQHFRNLGHPLVNQIFFRAGQLQAKRHIFRNGKVVCWSVNRKPSPAVSASAWRLVVPWWLSRASSCWMLQHFRNLGHPLVNQIFFRAGQLQAKRHIFRNGKAGA